MRLPLAVRCWFLADLIIALLPPVHWAFGDGATVFGAPKALVYLFGSSAFISASVVAAYLSDR